MPTTTMDCQTASGLDGGASSSVAASHSKPSHETNQPAPRCAQTKDATANGTVVRDTSNDAASPGQPQDVVVNATTTTGMVGNSDNNKAAKKNKKNKSKKSSKSGVAEKKHENYSGNQVPKAKNAAEELTLFQNSNLLNQRDPLEHLQQQLNQLILDDAGANGRFGVNRPQNNNIDPDKSLDQHKSTNLTSLSLESSQNYPQEPCALEYNVSSNMHTVKKGVLWLQQDHDKFHQRLFSRWKKRFFILTTDYLVCFKRSKSKVGRSTIRSAMGQFRWKDNLDEWMALIDSTRLKRRLRGGLAEGNSQVTMASNQNGIYENALLPAVRDGPLYNQTTIAPTANIDPLLLKQSSTGDALLLAQQSIISQTSEQNKENVIAAALIDPSAEGHFNHGLIEREHQMNGNQQQMDDSCGNNVAFHGGGSDAQATKLGSQRPHASMINDDDAPAKDEASKKERDQQQNLSSDDLLTSEKKRAQASKHSRDQSGHNGPSASASVSSTPRSTSVRQNQLGEGEKLEKNSCESASTNQTICRDSNDNLVPPMGAKSKREIAECADRANGSVLRLEEARDECHMESAAVTVLDERIATTTADKQSSKLHKSDADDDDDAVVNGTNQREDHHQMSEVERVEPSQRIEGRRSVKPERPVSNLIRRDDSWHSSLSLNQVGNNHMQAAAAAAVAAKRSLYTQNITTTSTATGQPSGKIGSGHFQQHSNINSVEATATPLRGRPPIRQQSMQLHNNRRLPPFGQLQTNSFDAAQIPSSPSQHYNNQQQQQQQQQLRQLQHPPTSYHQKLLQLQLLHNSNNIDYVRTNIELNNGYRTSNDYQIYGPGSIATTNHYGYYSMRSNLKSAASEFSFIRPNSSDFHPAGPAALLPQQQQQQQPSQAHQSEFSSGDILNQVQQHNNNRASLVLAANNHQLLDYENGMAGSPSSRGQYLTQNGLGNIRVTPGEHGVNNQYHKGLNGLNDLATAPNRDLPLKPNKKRQQLTGNGAQTQKNFGSSIVHFFRRAFSKRSKRRPKLATESCSSSLGGALDDKFESIQRTRSAFSTTEGTRIDRNEISDQQQSLITQRHRMIDLIEAFSNKTAIDQETYNKLAQQNCIDSIELDHQREPIQHEPSMQTKLAQQYRPQHLIGSPLHKSNSVSTSTGLSGLNEMMRLNERQMLLNNSQQSPAIGGPRNGAMSSPMVNRSTKVLSANLTPLYSRKETQEHHHEAAARYFASPRCSTNLEHLPRPSSIYGQPSMISSPVFSNSRDHRGASGSAGGDFGSHRSSIHSYHQRGSEREPINSSIDLRRHHQTIKAPFLDTTREVAEEVSSPTTETKAFIDYEAQQGGNCKQLLTDECRNSGPTTNNEMTPKNYSIRQQQQHQRRAIVNPILQSPTMSLIYDNHPMPINNGSSSNGAYSHYDNHRPIEYQQSMSSMDLSVHSYPQSINPASVDHQEELHHRTTNINKSNAIISPLAASRNLKMRQSFNLSGHTTSGLVTPSHRNMRLSQQQQQQQSNSIAPYQQELDRNLLEHAKPAAMIAPSTPTSHQLRGQEPSYALPRVVTESTSTGHFNPYSQSCSSRPNSMIKPSPIKAPQHQPTNSHYQQSPLVNRQTRVVKRGDGVQTTVIHPEVFALNGQEESVVNIVGAPGVNLEPSLAHSILRGTNINAFESSASAGLHMNSNRANANTKTFLVSSRLSKTINESPSNIGGVSNAKRNRMVPESDARLERERSKEDESLSRSTSSGTEPSSSSTTSSARSDSSARRRGTNENSVKSFQTEKVLDSGRDKKVGQRKESSGGGRSSGDSNRRRGSSTEHSDELSSQAESFDEPPPEGRKWVTSKLVQ